MRNKVLVSLVLIVILPTALLAWLGQRTVQNEQELLEAQLRTLVNRQLAGVDTSIQSYFRTVQESLIVQARGLDGSVEGLRKFSLASPEIRQVLVIAANGKVVFPSPSGNRSEREFLQRASAIMENPALLTQGAALPESDAAALTTAQGLLSKKFASSAGSAAPEGDAGRPAIGWYAWHWNAELHHMFWWRDNSQRVIGFELAPVAVMSDVIAGLPATDVQGGAGHSLTRLVNGAGRVIYEWGNYRPAARERSLAVWPLSHPLASWKLEYFAPPLLGGAAAGALGVLASVLMIGLALTGLAIFLYSEHTREMRVAQQRVNFVSQVSHELKTPLTNIRLYAELLQAEVEQFADNKAELAQVDTKAHKYIGIIVAESQRLSRLIGNVLSFGRFQKAELRLNREVGQVDEVVLRCIAAFQPALEAKDIKLQFDAQAGAPVLMDPQAVEQILNNLIGNVEKYAASGGALLLTSTQDSELTIIDVRDFGPGIALTERERVFQPFYRVSSLLTDGVAGTGIGLDIARRLARLHGGDVILQEVEAGACFRVTLKTPPDRESKMERT